MPTRIETGAADFKVFYKCAGGSGDVFCHVVPGIVRGGWLTSSEFDRNHGSQHRLRFPLPRPVAEPPDGGFLDGPVGFLVGE